MTVESAIRTLGITDMTGLTVVEAKKRFRQLAKKHHPDNNGCQDDFFIQLKEAFEKVNEYIADQEYLKEQVRLANEYSNSRYNGKIRLQLDLTDFARVFINNEELIFNNGQQVEILDRHTIPKYIVLVKFKYTLEYDGIKKDANCIGVYDCDRREICMHETVYVNSITDCFDLTLTVGDYKITKKIIMSYEDMIINYWQDLKIHLKITKSVEVDT